MQSGDGLAVCYLSLISWIFIEAESPYFWSISQKHLWYEMLDCLCSYPP